MSYQRLRRESCQDQTLSRRAAFLRWLQDPAGGHQPCSVAVLSLCFTLLCVEPVHELRNVGQLLRVKHSGLATRYRFDVTGR